MNGARSPTAQRALTLDARRPIRLDGRAGALLVVSGRLDLFLRAPSGRRRPWLRLQAGEAAVGFPDTGGDLEILAVGMNDCRVVDLDADADLDPALVAVWIERLRQTVPLDVKAAGPTAPFEELERLRRQAGPLLAAHLAAERRSEGERLVRQRERQTHQTTAALNELSGLVGRRRFAAPVGGAYAADPLGQACIDVARWLAVSAADPGSKGAASAARRFGMRARTVLLRGDWWADDTGPLIVWRDGAWADEIPRPAAIVAGPSNGREIVDPATGARTPLDATTARGFRPEGVSLYRSLPGTALQTHGLVRWLAPLVRRDVARLIFAGAALAVLALAAPALTQVIVTEAIGAADVGALSFCAAALLTAAIGGAGIQLIQSLAVLRLGVVAEATIEAALIDRILRLPAAFFRTYTVGDLSRRIEGMEAIRNILVARFASGFTALCICAASFALMAWIDVSLMLAALGFVLIQGAVAGGLIARRLGHEQAYYEARGQTAGLMVQMVTAVGKLRVAGASGRALALWMTRFAEQKRRFIRARRASGALTAFNGAFPLIAILVLYALAAKRIGSGGEASIGPLIAFFAAFGESVVGIGLLANAVGEVAAAAPNLNGVQAILAAEPEPRPAQGGVLSLSGALEVRHVRFAYPGQSNAVLDGLSFNVKAGEFVALIGSSGSGKSTVFRLLLGFERPLQGSILYDGRPLEGLDLDAVRSQIGVVLQDGRLRPGNLYENICGGWDPPAEQVWEAVRRAGLQAEIEAMPMGLRTIVAEGASTLSGGQRQRLMIARALVRKPGLLLFDEATSALDNTTQAAVADAIGELQVTRIVIAHRVSTIRNADRILVIDRGAIVQEGRFEALSAQVGPFADLVGRQII